MSTTRKTITATLVALLGTCASVHAADLPAAAPATPAEAVASAFDATVSFAFTSDYVFRGISQTGEDPAAQPSIELRYNTFYVGAFASNVDFNAPDPDIEVDLVGGFRPTIGDFTFDIGAIAYFYDDSDIDYVEGKFGVSRTFFEKLSLGVTAFASPDFLNLDEESVYIEGTAGYSLPYNFTLSGGVGAQFVSGDVLEDYVTGNVGLSYKAFDAITLDVRYFDTTLDEDECVAYSGFERACDSRVVGTIKFDLVASQINKR